MKNKNLLKELSKQLIQSKKYHTQPGQCYFNSFMNTLPLSKLFPSAIYVEGHVFLNWDFDMAHAWIETDEGIIELTGKIVDQAERYVPFVKFKPTELIKMIPKKGRQYYPLTNYYGTKEQIQQYNNSFCELFGINDRINLL